MFMRRVAFGVFSIALLSVVSANAAGFAIIEQGVKGLGNAYAGAAASAEDATTVFFNPAGMTRIVGQQVVAAFHVIAPKTEFSGTATTAVGAPIAGNDGGQGGEAGIAPNLYYVRGLENGWAVGLGVNAPFGLVTTWSEGWVGRYHALRSEVATINVNPSVAWRVKPGLSLGVGLNAQYIDAELSNAIDFGSIVGPLIAPGAIDGKSELAADDWGFGYNLGVLYEFDENTRLGLAYRSPIEYTLDGEADFAVPSRFTGDPSSDALIGAGLALAGFADTDAKADITLPGNASLSFFHRFNEAFAVMGDITLTDWSELDELRVEFDNALPDNVTDESWEDNWRYSVGTTFSPRPELDLRLGAAFDETPIPDAAHRTPRIPGGDRLWLAFGLGYRLGDTIALDFAYAHLFVEETEIRKVVGPGSSSSEIARGNLVGEFDNSVDIASLQVTWDF